MLVFPSQEAKIKFVKLYQTVIEQDGFENANDNALGAAFKLRAVKTSDDRFMSVIRCGVTARQLFESHEKFNEPDEALTKVEIPGLRPGWILRLCKDFNINQKIHKEKKPSLCIFFFTLSSFKVNIYTLYEVLWLIYLQGLFCDI